MGDAAVEDADETVGEGAKGSVASACHGLEAGRSSAEHPATG